MRISKSRWAVAVAASVAVFSFVGCKGGSSYNVPGMAWFNGKDKTADTRLASNTTPKPPSTTQVPSGAPSSGATTVTASAGPVSGSPSAPAGSSYPSYGASAANAYAGGYNTGNYQTGASAPTSDSYANASQPGYGGYGGANPYGDPNPYAGTQASTGYRTADSGAAYATLPSKSPLLGPAGRVTPKSINFTMLLSSTSTFRGQRSRWIQSF